MQTIFEEFILIAFIWLIRFYFIMVLWFHKFHDNNQHSVFINEKRLTDNVCVTVKGESFSARRKK